MNNAEIEFPINFEATFSVPIKGNIAGGDPTRKGIPRSDADYVFSRERLADMIVFWNSKRTNAAKLVGDPAAGKTSLVREWHARLNVPLYAYSCNKETTSDQLIGQFVPKEDGSFYYNYGVVALAAKEGVSVLLDEGNAMLPNATLALHMLLEGDPVYIAETGETIYPAPGFRVYWTENSVSSKLMVAGRYVHDSSSDDRFFEIKVGYLGREEEIDVVLKSISNKMPDEQRRATAAVMVDMANKVREAYNNPKSRVVKPLSTRVLRRWAELAWSYRGVKSKDHMIYALERAFSNVPPDMWTEMVGIYEGLGTAAEAS